MAADRRIGPMRQSGTILAQLRVQRLAHAMQSLKLEFAFAAGKLENGCDRERIVSGELRENARPQRQQVLRADSVVEVGHRLAGKYRIVLKAALLRAFDLAIPVSTL